MFVLKAAAVTLVSIPLLILGLVAATGLVVVDVKPEDGPRIVVPVPLVLAKVALPFVPQEAKDVEIPELSEYAGVAARIVDEIRDSEDGVLVEVEDRNDHVLIEKIGDELAIEVTGDHEEVSVRVPLKMVAGILESYDGKTLDVARALSAVSSSSYLSGTDLVHVKSDDDEVRVWIW